MKTRFATVLFLALSVVGVVSFFLLRQEKEIISEATMHSIPLEEIKSGGPPKDGIPPIDDPKFISVQAATEWLADEEPGIAFSMGSTHRFYPYQIMVWHEIVNDTIEGQRVLVTYCPLCLTGYVLDPVVQGERVEFGTSGKLWKSNLVMYDRKTDSYWPQTLGKAVLGPSTGKTIKKIPTDTVKWGDWKKAHPNTKVLSKDTGFLRSYDGSNPYGRKGDFTDINLQFPLENEDKRLDAYEIIYGIEVNGKFKAYKKTDLGQKSKIEDTLGGEKIMIEFDKNLKSARAYKESEEQVVVDTLFWFAWAAFHPETELYNPK